MSLKYFLSNWGPCRASLHQHFPQFTFPQQAPDPRDLNLALDGLAAMHELTKDELIETVVDLMIFAPAPHLRLAA